MINVQVGDVVIYEGRECKITKLTENTAELTNLNPKNDNDWFKVKVSITDIREDQYDE